MMPIIKKLLVLFALIPGIVQANFNQAIPSQSPLYVGLISGYGSTTWRGLVPKKINQNGALNISTPYRVKEGGFVWGGFAGYELLPTFAVEASYVRYPNATVYFDKMSLVAFQNHGMTELLTHTETIDLIAKIMMIIPQTTLRAFSSAGIAAVHRYDKINNCWRASPTFSLGLNYNFSRHVMGEIGLNYTGGYGESELNPTIDYVPFLFSSFVRLAYRF